MRGYLILDDGTKYEGTIFGAEKCVSGEIGKSFKFIHKFALIINVL